MGGPNRRSVYQRDDGTWANKNDGASRPASIHKTQREAIGQAREMLENVGGGELTVMGVNGKIRSKDTIAPGPDPCPPRDKEH